MNVNCVFFMLCGLWLSMAVEQSNCCSEEDSKVCAADEFFDFNVCLCSSCAGFCQLKPDRSIDPSCRHYCQEYRKQTNFSSLAPKGSSVGSTSIALLPVHEDNALVKKPLFWTSVVSVFISVVATVILVVLCTCKKSRPALALHRNRRMPQSHTRMPAKKAKGESSTGMLRNVEGASDPLLTSEKNFAKQICGNAFALPMDHAVTLDSCAVDHETVVSLCQSSYLHKPCVASFEDFGSLFNNANMHLFSTDDSNSKDTSFTGTSINTSVNISTNTNAVTSTDISVQRMDSGRLEDLEGRSPFEGLEKPLEAIENCSFESGYFNSGMCKSVTNWKEESPVTYAVYTVPLSSRKAANKETKRHSSFHAQETDNLRDERNGVANWKRYTEILPFTFYGSESKAKGNRWLWDSGVKPSVLTLQGRVKDLTCDESALKESSEETRLKLMQTDIYCILNNMPEYSCSASHLEPSCDRCVPAKDLSVHESEKQGDGKQLRELNLKMRSINVDTVKSEHDVLNVEIRNFSRCTEDNNEEGTILKT